MSALRAHGRTAREETKVSRYYSANIHVMDKGYVRSLTDVVSVEFPNIRNALKRCEWVHVLKTPNANGLSLSMPLGQFHVSTTQCRSIGDPVAVRSSLFCVTGVEMVEKTNKLSIQEVQYLVATISLAHLILAPS